MLREISLNMLIKEIMSMTYLNSSLLLNPRLKGLLLLDSEFDSLNDVIDLLRLKDPVDTYCEGFHLFERAGDGFRNSFCTGAVKQKLIVNGRCFLIDSSNSLLNICKMSCLKCFSVTTDFVALLCNLSLCL